MMFLMMTSCFLVVSSWFEMRGWQSTGKYHQNCIHWHLSWQFSQSGWRPMDYLNAFGVSARADRRSNGRRVWRLCCCGPPCPWATWCKATKKLYGAASPGDDLPSRELVWPWDALHSTVLGLDQKRQLPVSNCNPLQFSPLLIPTNPVPDPC